MRLEKIYPYLHGKEITNQTKDANFLGNNFMKHLMDTSSYLKIPRLRINILMY